MFKFFKYITNLIKMVVEFVINFITMLVYAITFIAQGLTYVFSIIMYLPPWVLTFVTAVIAWCVIMFILNRD